MIAIYNQVYIKTYILCHKISRSLLLISTSNMGNKKQNGGLPKLVP